MSGDTRQVTLKLSKAAHKQLEALLAQHLRLYNAALENRFTAWKTHKVNITKKEQSRQLTGIRADNPDWTGQDRRLAIGTLDRVDRAYKTWLKRIGAGLSKGRPRYKSVSRFRTLEIYSGVCNYLKVNESRTNGVIKIKGVPPLRFRMPSRPLPQGQPLMIRITKTPCRVTASLVYDIEVPEQPIGQPERPLGIDLGVANTVVTQHGVIPVTPPRAEQKYKKQVRKLQRRMQRQRDAALKEKRAWLEPVGAGKVRLTWSKLSGLRYQQTRQALKRVHERQRLSMKNWQHRITSQLVKDHDFIAVEDLQIQNMSRSASGTVEEPGRNVAQQRGLSRSILEQGWGGILSQLEYKAERAGVRFVRVQPQHTSQACSQCGLIDSKNRPSQPVFRCVDCGYTENADVNAAWNILRRGLATLGLAESLPACAADVREPNQTVGSGAHKMPSPNIQPSVSGFV